MPGILVLIVNIWLLSSFLLFLHYQTPRFGFAPMLAIAGGLMALIESQQGVYITLSPGLTIFTSSGVLVPALLMLALVIYAANGAIAARDFIFSAMLVGFVILACRLFDQLYMALPGGGMLYGNAFPAIGFQIRELFASLISFGLDIVVIAITYQGTRNHAAKLPAWFTVGLALLIGLWTDAVAFRIFRDLGSSDFVAFLPGDLLAKTLSAIILWPIAAYYLVRIGPSRPDHLGVANRPTFDLLFGSITHIKRALKYTEAALEQSEVKRREETAYFRQISENINEALWLVSTENEKFENREVLFVNPAYERIRGLPAEVFRATPTAFLDSVYPEDREFVLKAMANQNENNSEVEYRIVRPDGSIRWIRDRAFNIRNEAGRVYRTAGITEDITEHKLLELQNNELALEREKVNWLREFIAEATHDLKTPLTAINLKIYGLRHAQDSARQQRYLADLTALASRLGQMIEDLLVLARLETSNHMRIVAVNLNPNIQEICEVLRPVAEEKAIQTELDLDNISTLMEIDQDDLLRAFTNLIENAVHYTPRDGKVSIRLQVTDDEVIFSVRDTGIGIAIEDQVHIFERFYRAQNAREADPGGTGLGLAIAKKVIERHKGQISVSSVVGVGTTFIVRLPTLKTGSETQRVA